MWIVTIVTDLSRGEVDVFGPYDTEDKAKAIQGEIREGVESWSRHPYRGQVLKLEKW